VAVARTGAGASACRPRWLTSVAAVIAAIGVIASSPSCANRRGATRSGHHDHRACAAISTSPFSTVDGVTTIELEAGYDAIGEMRCPTPSTCAPRRVFPEATRSPDASPSTTQLKLIQPAYVVTQRWATPRCAARQHPAAAGRRVDAHHHRWKFGPPLVPGGTRRINRAVRRSLRPRRHVGFVGLAGPVGRETTTTEAAALVHRAVAAGAPDGYTFESAVRTAISTRRWAAARFVGPEAAGAQLLSQRSPTSSDFDRPRSQTCR
jgi:hypothetical protein